MQKTASKNIISSGSCEFLNQAITIVCKLLIAISQNDFRDIFEKTIQAISLKLGSYFPFMSS